MSTGLLKLPDERICMILSLLRPSQVKRVALTFNHRLLTIAIPFFAPLTKIKKDEAYFESLYGDMGPGLSIDTPVIDEQYLEMVDFMDLPISVPFRPSCHLEYLDLKDDPSWYEDVFSEDDYDDEFDNGHSYILDFMRADLERLIQTTARLGLDLPLSFIKFLRSEELLEKWPTGNVWDIAFSPLIKMRNQFENDHTRHQDVYIFTWYIDQQFLGQKHMYLDTAGRHAVMGSDDGLATPKFGGEEDDWMKLSHIYGGEDTDQAYLIASHNTWWKT